MLELEHGIVKWFDPRSNKQFGFLCVLDENGKETGGELFFHLGDGEWVDIVEDNIEFVGPNFSDGGHPISAYAPTAGTILAFLRAPGKDGREKACPWTLAEGYDNRVRKLTEPFYRVTKSTKLGYGGPGDTSQVIWEGQGATALSAEYPIRVLDGKLDDPLTQWADMSAGSTTRYSFEIRATPGMTDDTSCPPEGYWLSCPDPRPRSDMARELESAS